MVQLKMFWSFLFCGEIILVKIQKIKRNGNHKKIIVNSLLILPFSFAKGFRLQHLKIPVFRVMSLKTPIGSIGWPLWAQISYSRGGLILKETEKSLKINLSDQNDLIQKDRNSSILKTSRVSTCHLKGQLISKGLFDAFNSSKQRTKKFDLRYYGTSIRCVFVRLLEELKISKSPFEINWPLVES